MFYQLFESTLQLFGTDLVTFEMAGLLQHWKLFGKNSRSYFSKVKRSAPPGQIKKFDPLLDAPGSKVSSALRINIVWQTCERMETILSEVREALAAPYCTIPVDLLSNRIDSVMILPRRVCNYVD